MNHLEITLANRKRLTQLEDFVLKEFTKTFNLQNSIHILKNKIQILEKRVDYIKNRQDQIIELGGFY